ncbi:hypothetical protein BASA82_000042 [Batrachochytrium salamandrivorans]|nr:hypothetical protein BASA82_000042 [Batrachochytrium salamandrivorans]
MCSHSNLSPKLRIGRWCSPLTSLPPPSVSLRPWVFRSQRLTHALHSLVRVSRRGVFDHFVCATGRRLRSLARVPPFDSDSRSGSPTQGPPHGPPPRTFTQPKATHTGTRGPDTDPQANSNPPPHCSKALALQTISGAFNSLFRVLFIFPSRYSRLDCFGGKRCPVHRGAADRDPPNPDPEISAVGVVPSSSPEVRPGWCTNLVNCPEEEDVLEAPGPIGPAGVHHRPPRWREWEVNIARCSDQTTIDRLYAWFDKAEAKKIRDDHKDVGPSPTLVKPTVVKGAVETTISYSLSSPTQARPLNTDPGPDPDPDPKANKGPSPGSIDHVYVYRSKSSKRLDLTCFVQLLPERRRRGYNALQKQTSPDIRATTGKEGVEHPNRSFPVIKGLMPANSSITHQPEHPQHKESFFPPKHSSDLGAFGFLEGFGGKTWQNAANRGQSSELADSLKTDLFLPRSGRTALWGLF